MESDNPPLLYTQHILWTVRQGIKIRQVMETIKKWWRKPNWAYSKFCRDSKYSCDIVTNGQVVLTNLTCLLIVAACCVAEFLDK